LTILTEASVQNVATKKAYVVPAVTGQRVVGKETLGTPGGFGETQTGLFIFETV
jgi:hypothetical protein